MLTNRLGIRIIRITNNKQRNTTKEVDTLQSMDETMFVQFREEVWKTIFHKVSLHTIY